MPVVYKVLGQQSPAANSLVPLYSVAGTGLSRMTVCSTLNVCNRSDTDALRYTVEISPDGSGSKPEHRQFHSVSLAPGQTDAITLGWTLQAGAVVRISATSASSSFTLFGQELTP